MKKAMFFNLNLLLFVSALCLPHSFAQDSPQWGLPESAKACLGKGIIREIQYSPDGTRLAVASSIGIWLYDTANHQEIALLAGHTSIESVAFSPDGGTIAGGSRGATIQLWDADTGEPLRSFTGHRSKVTSVVFSPDGRKLASASGDYTARLWRTDTGQHLRTLKGHAGRVSSVVFSPDGRTLASASGDYTARLWRTDTGQHLRTLEGHTLWVTSVVFSPDGRTHRKCECGRNHPYMGRRYRESPANAQEAYVWGHERCVQSRWS